MAEDDIRTQLKAIFSTTAHSETENAKKLAKKHADKLRNKIASDSPKRTGGYAKGWKADVYHESEFGICMIVHNEDYRLPHLLENSHIIYANDGKGYYIVKGKTKPHPHIKRNAEKEFESFYDDLSKADVDRMNARFKSSSRKKGSDV